MKQNIPPRTNMRHRAADEPPSMPVLRSESEPAARDERLSRCEAAVMSCFPDICPEFLKSQAPNHEWDPERLTIHLLDEQEKGSSYPKRSNLLKRKRPEKDEESKQDAEDEMRKKLEQGDPRHASKGRAYVKLYTKTS